MTKYLYGASVQGIQGFIFRTNKLKEIVGASEIVEQICTEDFFEVARIDKNDKNLILAAAGNIKCVFDDITKLEALVRLFPKHVMEKAPGITISQAVVAFEEGEEIPLDDLEKALKIQRNKPSMPIETGFMSLERSRRTGGVAFKEIVDRKGRKELICEATDKKIQVVKDQVERKDDPTRESLIKKLTGITSVKNGDLSFDITDITASGYNNWIAVVHADGNGLGNILQNIGAELTNDKKFYEFSQAIENSTKAALQIGFNEVIEKDKEAFLSKEEHKTKVYRYPIRPIIIGGDDVTFIIRADLALDFTEHFLREFEKQTKHQFTSFEHAELKEGLTACAGIAYVKESYPLHYALDLAAQLTKDAKKFVKQIVQPPEDTSMPKSSLAFFKVQDSFVESLTDMKERTKVAKLDNDKAINYNYGPYLNDPFNKHPNLVDLKYKLKILIENKSDQSKGVSKLRQLITESFKDKATMQFMKNRMESVNDKLYKDLALGNELKPYEIFNKVTKEKTIDFPKSMLLDLIQLHSFKYK